MNLYFSDPHFNHVRMSKNRGFSDVKEMNEHIINGINSKSTTKDILYCLGDVFWEGSHDEIRNFLKRLKFKKLIFIKGNHDEPLIHFLKHSKDTRLELHTDLFIHDYGFKIHLYHYPIFDWDKKFHKQWHLYGHQHEIRSDGVEMMNLPYSYNVNLELNNYMPVSMKEIVDRNK